MQMIISNSARCVRLMELGDCWDLTEDNQNLYKMASEIEQERKRMHKMGEMTVEW